MPPAIECHGVGKAFILRTNRQRLLKDRLLSVVRSHLRESRRTFWALQDVSFTVDPGETIGIIGPNGAGKTTLLRVVAGIFQPSAGTVRIRGRLAPLLEVAVGFHSELTGRENIYLAASLYGLTTREIRAAEAGIIEFSELGEFIDVPTKNYSTGMRLRLGFAIATHIKPDIFVIDEVFAVGDEFFQEKCLQILERERQAGCACLVSTHDLPFVEETCTRAALIVGGRMITLGPPKDVVALYRELNASR
ncbi:MAG TPA: ABC transporter ATP-binding protein [Candidatus Methylomirabilis sp.]|nr:ABC transporter ATP-binding protein [Candidatus Methylomirabilis sp.]